MAISRTISPISPLYLEPISLLYLDLGDLAHDLALEPHRAHLRPEAPLQREALARTQRALLGGGGLGEGVVEALQLCIEPLDDQVLLGLLAQAERLR